MTVGDCSVRRPETADVMERLGEAVWLMLRSPGYRQADLARVEALFLTPILLDQLRVFRRGSRPVGLVAWAFLDEEAEARYLRTGVLGSRDWQGGTRLWFTDFLAPFGDVRSITKAACSLIPPGQTAYGTRRYPDGSVRRITRHRSNRDDTTASLPDP